MAKFENNSSKIAVISDTHGLLRPALLELLTGVSLIIHAGDICSDEILQQLQSIAPVRAVRGNMDRSGLCGALPEKIRFEFSGYSIYLIHDINRMDLSVTAVDLVIHGHTHQPSYEFSGDTTYLNPGSCGPRRGEKPICFCFLDLTVDEPQPKFVDLDS